MAFIIGEGRASLTWNIPSSLIPFFHHCRCCCGHPRWLFLWQSNKSLTVFILHQVITFRKILVDVQLKAFGLLQPRIEPPIPPFLLESLYNTKFLVDTIILFLAGKCQWWNTPHCLPINLGWHLKHTPAYLPFFNVNVSLQDQHICA